MMMGRMLTNPRVRQVIGCIKFVKRQFWKKQNQDRFLDEPFVREAFKKHIEEVKAYVPEDQLLVYDIRQGWAPLCEFLGVPEPTENLPHLNKRENFKTMLQGLIKTGKMVEA
jgi:hypothetical protein